MRSYWVFLLGFVGMLNLSAQTDFDTIVDYDGFFDALDIEEIVITSPFEDQKRNSSNLSISTLDLRDPKNKHQPLSQLLESIPGIFVDGSIGEVQNRVHNRGISVAAEDDIGWYYMSLMEDGLPVTMTQHTFYSPDLFFRMDQSIDKLEVIRGGQSSLLGINAPGGIFNNISKEGGIKPQGAWDVAYGLSGQSRQQVNLDVQLDGPLNQKKGLFYSVGLHYRFDEGARNTDFNLSEGGQIKANLKKITNRSIFKLRLKYLNDVTNRYLGLPATNWSDPTPTNGFDFNHTALTLPSFAAQIPDARSTDPNAFIDYDSSKGIQAQDVSLQFDWDYQLSDDFTFKFKTKWSRKDSDWNSSIGNQILGLESFLPYDLSSHDNPWGQINFHYVNSGALAAAIDNTGALNVFSGGAPTFEYLSPESLPNDALLGTGLWIKDDNAVEWMNQFSLSGEVGKHKLSANWFYGVSLVNMYTSASYAYATYEENPQLLSVRLVNGGGDILLSDAIGVSNYNGLFYEDGNSTNVISSINLLDQWNINGNWTAHLGLKFEHVDYEGVRYFPSIVSGLGGLDQNFSTGFDNSAQQRDSPENFQDAFNTLSYSIGVDHKVSERSNIFVNYANGNKAPELNYYFNTFRGVPILEDPTVQNIQQLELGYNFKGTKSILALVGFYSILDNFSSNDFAADANTGEIFYTPFQNNKVSVLGIEGEMVFHLNDFFNVASSITLQSSNADRFTVYDANGSVDTSDDTISDFSGRKIAHTPTAILSIRPSYDDGVWSGYANLRYTSARYGNAENSFELPAFATLGAGVRFKSGRFIWGLDGSNLLNSTGLLNFFGPDQFASSANQATAEFINANPDGRFIVFPTMPRAMRLSVGYSF